MARYILIILCSFILFPFKINCQNKDINFEIAPFLGTNLSFSKLKELQKDRYYSPPSFGFISGINIEYLPKSDSSSITFNSSYTSLDLSISSGFKIQEKLQGMEHNTTITPTFDLWTFGVKKYLWKGNKFNYYFETGPRLHFGRNAPRQFSHFISNWLDSGIEYKFEFEFERSFTIVPYIGSGFDVKIKKVKFGAYFWFQRSFIPLMQYDLYVKYGSSEFKTKSISYGMAVGGHLYLRVFSF